MSTAIKRLLPAIALGIALVNSASADVWKWVDPLGKTHFVDTQKPIFTWLDETGKAHFSDKPAHKDAVAVQLTWHSKGNLADMAQTNDAKDDDAFAFPGESVEEREQRRQAKAYYCKRATQLYNTYADAPRLYKDGDNGQPVYLSDEEQAQAIEKAKQQKEKFCS